MIIIYPPAIRNISQLIDMQCRSTSSFSKFSLGHFLAGKPKTCKSFFGGRPPTRLRKKAIGRLILKVVPWPIMLSLDLPFLRGIITRKIEH